MLDRVMLFGGGVSFLIMAWAMATREFWTTDGARALLDRKPGSAARRWNLRLDLFISRVAAPLLLAGFGLWWIAAAVLP